MVIIQDAVHNFGVNLTPGRFVNTITAILPGGTRSTQPDKITITVMPFWWQTVWVKLLIIAMVAFVVFRMFKTRAAFLKLQNTASELQLQAIKSQMNPHFVGNSINAIQQFFYPPDPVKASEYISIFSDLLRRTMSFSEVDFIPFQDELTYVRDYLEMVKLRFGEHFSYTISGVEKIGSQAMFPAMVLQPILENATMHGLSPEGVSHLTVHFDEDKHRLTTTLTDNGVGIEESQRRKRSRPPRRTSKGLILLDKKVQMLNKLYAVDLKVTTTDRRQLNDSSNGTQVIISFLNTSPSNRAKGDQ
ncbi:MAG: sensor histidine kinase [Saprospiraceae bacterium]|nr:sensor histidine kinase [Saprospiraceae bacterium]